MNKTSKSVKKRFKITGNGKILRRKPGKRHMMRKKTKKQLKAMNQNQLVLYAFASKVRKVCPKLF